MEKQIAFPCSCRENKSHLTNDRGQMKDENSTTHRHRCRHLNAARTPSSTVKPKLGKWSVWELKRKKQYRMSQPVATQYDLQRDRRWSGWCVAVGRQRWKQWRKRCQSNRDIRNHMTKVSLHWACSTNAVCHMHECTHTAQSRDFVLLYTVCRDQEDINIKLKKTRNSRDAFNRGAF